MTKNDARDKETIRLAAPARTIHVMLSDPDWTPSMLEDAREILLDAGLVDDVPGVNWPKH